MKTLLMLFGFIVIMQIACASKAELSPESVSTDLQKAETEAQKFIESSIKFGFTINADGVTGDGGTYTAHGYKSPDGIEIGTQVGVYKKEENANKCFENALKDSSSILKRKPASDESGKTNERIIAISKKESFFDGKYLVAKKEGNICKVYFSSSLKYLLAFEKWHDRN